MPVSNCSVAKCPRWRQMSPPSLVDQRLRPHAVLFHTEVVLGAGARPVLRGDDSEPALFTPGGAPRVAPNPVGSPVGGVTTPTNQL